MDDPDDEALIQEILPVLELDTTTRAWSKTGTTSLSPDPPLRPAGRRATGPKIRTLAGNPDRRDDRRIAVWVIVINSNPDDEERIRERSELLVSQTLNQLLG